MKYIIKKAECNEIEKVINDAHKQGFDFVAFVPFANSGIFGKQQILFRGKK